MVLPKSVASRMLIVILVCTLVVVLNISVPSNVMLSRTAAVVDTAAPMATADDVVFTDVPAQLPPLEQQRPSFLILGAQKGGTTALSYQLNKHPHIYNSRKKVKELHFFDRKLSSSALSRGSINVTKVRRKYAKYFKHVDYSRNTNRTFEATPSYLLYTHTALPRIVHVCPWAKFVAVLRHPVARAYSQYKMIVARKNRSSIPANTTFAAWVQEDFAKMQAAGLVEPANGVDRWKQQLCPGLESEDEQPTGRRCRVGPLCAHNLEGPRSGGTGSVRLAAPSVVCGL